MLLWQNTAVEDALNRFGIILNVVAGFLLSPQLIGLQRIRSTQEYAERVSAMARDRLRGHLDQRWGRLREEAWLPAMVAVYSVTGFAATWMVRWTTGWGIPPSLATGLALTSLLLMVTSNLPSRLYFYLATRGPIWNDKLWNANLYTFLTIILHWSARLPLLAFRDPKGCLHAIPTAIVGIPLLFAALVLALASRVIVDGLEGHDRLLGALTAIGVACFIVGNAVQFVATFHPR